MTPHAATATAANPYGCNQHRHAPGCPHAGGGVDPDLKQNLEAALRRARREDGTVEQGGELNRTHEVRLREMPDVMKALGEPDVPLVMTVYHIRKLAGKHGLTVEQMQEVADKINDPLLVMHAEQQKHLLLLDMDAYEKTDKAMRPVICFVEKKPGKEHAEYVVSAYPLQKEKYRKVIGQRDALKYVKYKDAKTAQLPAVAPQCPEARDLLLAAMKDGFADSVLTWEDIVKPKKRPATDSIHAAAKPLRHEEYVPALTPDATYRTSQEWAELAPEMRVGKFFLACVEDERLLLAMHKLVDECMQAGVSEDEFIHRAFLMLGEIEDPLTGKPYYEPAARQDIPYDERIAYDNDVKNIDARARLKLIYRTQSELAAGYAQWQKALEPDNLRRFPAWRFVRQPGARIKRPDHVEHENEVRLISDTEYWLARNSPDQGGFNQPFPPFGYNSWMRVERVSWKEAVKLGLLAKDEEPTPPPDADRWSLRQAVEQANTASLDTLPPESVERIKERCREAGITLTPAASGGYTAKPAPGAAPHLPFTDNLEEELNELMRLLGEFDPPPASAAPTLPWLSTLFGKLLPPTDPGDTYASNPYGCNQHGHKPGCPHAGGGVDPDLKQNLDAALRRARREDGTVEQGGELNRTHEVRLREMPDVMKALGEPDVPLVMTVYHIRKVSNGHKLSVSKIEDAVKSLGNPVLTVLEADGSYLHLLDTESLNSENVMAPLVGVVRKKSNREDARFVVSFYPLDEDKESKFTQQFKRLVYCRQNKTAKFTADAPASNKASELLRAAIDGGFAGSVLTWEDIVKPKKRPGPDSIHAAANPYGCNQHRHKPGCPQKGTTREPQTKGTPRRVHKVDQTQPIHKQISALADALERAARDGTRLEAVIYRPEFGELTLDCGNPGKSTDPIGKGGHGVQHALEERHHVSERDIAHTLLTGKVTIQTDHPSRLRVETEQFRVVLERELINNSGRISNTRATLHTAMKRP